MKSSVNNDDEPRTRREMGWELYHDPYEPVEPCWFCFPGGEMPTSFDEFFPDPNCVLCGGSGVFWDEEWEIPEIYDSDCPEKDENE